MYVIISTGQKVVKILPLKTGGEIGKVIPGANFQLGYNIVSYA